MKVPSPSLPPAAAGSAIFPAVAEGVARIRLAAEILPGSAAQPKAREANPQQLQQAVDELQRKVQVSSPNLQFSIDHDTGKTVIKVIDTNTNEVIRQLPPEEMLQLAKEIDRMRGLLLHKQG